MSIHNSDNADGWRTDRRRMAHGSRTVVVLAFLVLAGFGCDEPARVPPGGEQPTSDAGGTITAWATYTSPTLGITIPYPEGWYVEADVNGKSVDFYQQEPPASSDAPSQLWTQTSAAGGIDAAISGEFPVVYERTNSVRGGRTMAHIIYPYDARLRSDERMVSYIWQEGNFIHMMGAPEGSDVLEYAIDHMEVSP